MTNANVKDNVQPAVKTSAEVVHIIVSFRLEMALIMLIVNLIGESAIGRFPNDRD